MQTAKHPRSHWDRVVPVDVWKLSHNSHELLLHYLCVQRGGRRCRHNAVLTGCTSLAGDILAAKAARLLDITRILLPVSSMNAASMGSAPYASQAIALLTGRHSRCNRVARI